MVLYGRECYELQGSVFEVYRELGSGFLEAVYQECLEREFARRGIPFLVQPELALYYKGEQLNKSYRPDFVCFGKIIVELKAVRELCGQHQAQVLNYLKASDMKLGLLVNFGSYPLAVVKRLSWFQSSS